MAQVRLHACHTPSVLHDVGATALVLITALFHVEVSLHLRPVSAVARQATVVRGCENISKVCLQAPESASCDNMPQIL